MPKPVVGIVKLGKRGMLVLPRRIRAAMGIAEGDEVVLTVWERRLVVERKGRGLGTYLAGEPGARSEEAVASPPQRRGLARFFGR